MTAAEQRELDAWIGDHLFGCTGGPLQIHLPHYSTDHAAAMAVLAKCAEKCEHEKIRYWRDGKWHNLKISTMVHSAETLPEAICLLSKEIFT